MSEKEPKFVDAFLIDLNGVERGKRLPAKDAAKIERSGLRFPRSLIGVDVWGSDVFDNGLVVDTGDGDGQCALLPPGNKVRALGLDAVASGAGDDARGEWRAV
jgi:glutamine synthetase